MLGTLPVLRCSRSPFIALVAVMLLGSCKRDKELPTSEPIDPSAQLTSPAPVVDTGWPVDETGGSGAT